MTETQLKDAMATLICPTCAQSLYLRIRILESQSWQCPSCLVKHKDIRTLGGDDYKDLRIRY